MSAGEGSIPATASAVSRGEPPRYAPARGFPAYAYVPGRNPHPVSDPRGHLYGCEPSPLKIPLDPGDWLRELACGIDLFNHGYYWEAHETWERLWHGVGQQGPAGDLLKGLIKLAAAGVKVREGRLEGVRRHALRAGELLRQARAAWSRAPDSRPVCWDWEQLLNIADEVAARPHVDETRSTAGYRVWDWVIAWRDLPGNS